MQPLVSVSGGCGVERTAPPETGLTVAGDVAAPVPSAFFAEIMMVPSDGSLMRPTGASTVSEETGGSRSLTGQVTRTLTRLSCRFCVPAAAARDVGAARGHPAGVAGDGVVGAVDGHDARRGHVDIERIQDRADERRSRWRRG